MLGKGVRSRAWHTEGGEGHNLIAVTLPGIVAGMCVAFIWKVDTAMIRLGMVERSGS